MITQDQLREHIGRRPFRAFWVTLTTGEGLDVPRTNQAVATRRRLVVATQDDRFRWIRLEQITGVEPAEAERV